MDLIWIFLCYKKEKKTISNYNLFFEGISNYNLGEVLFYLFYSFLRIKIEYINNNSEILA